uniref:MAK10-like protein n=1 Tax=Tanacetum cinerariifolium TaxID=118510 RepID=A0A6L2N824_TANCI|nr:MAK10-like protein [Tanacetum cinerariifolium]
MRDSNPIRTLGDFSKPSHEGYINTIELPVRNNVDPSTHERILLLVSLLNSFHRKGLQNSTMTSLCSNNIKESLFLKHGFVSRTYSNESLNMASIFRNVKEPWALLEDLALYDNKSWNNQRDFAKPIKAISLPQDVPSTSGRHLIEIKNQVQCLMEAHLNLRQPTKVNKITSSWEICSGPHDTQYCMENPEQTFVEYASSHTDEARGEWYTFKPEHNNLGDTYNPSWKIHPSLRNGYEYGGRNFIRLGRDMHVFVGNMSYVMDFTVLENIETDIDIGLSQVVFGRTFVEIAYLAINRRYGLMTFANEIKEITFKTPYKDPKRSELSSEGHDLLLFRVILSEDDYDRGCRKPSDLEDGFYRDTTKLGSEYLTGMDDEGEVT